jgi:hypothetical protein
MVYTFILLTHLIFNIILLLPPTSKGNSIGTGKSPGDWALQHGYRKITR